MPPTPNPSPTGSDQPAQRAGIRPRIERASTPALTKLAALPTVLPFLIMFAVLLVGVFLGGLIGGLLLLIPILFLSWLLYLTWPHLRRSERLLRVAVLLLVLGIAVTQIIPR